MAANPFGPPPELYGYQTLWHSIGNYMARLEQYERSMPFFDEAVLKCPNDKKILVDRGKVLGKLCFFKRALEDINKAIDLDPDDLVSLAERSHAIYLSCEFEDAIVQNYRLLPLRKKPDHFSMGIRKCSIAIQNCLGDVAGCPLRDHFLIIRKLAWLENFNAGRRVAFVAKNKKIKKPKKMIRKQKKTDTGKEDVDEEMKIWDSLHSHELDKFAIPPLQKSFNFSPLQRYTTNIENYMAETYLERMYKEKVFLKELSDIPGIKCPNETGVKKIKEIIKDCYSTVYGKQEVLRTRRPFYTVKYQQAKISGALKDRLEAELSLHQDNTRKEADKICVRLRAALKERNLNGLLELVEKLKLYCDNKSKRLLPEKQSYLNLVYESVRDGFYMLNRLNPDQPKWEQEKRILLSLGQPISKDPSRDSVIEVYRAPLIDYNQQIQLFENRLEAAENDDETLWYYYELARYHMMAKHYDAARSYCMRGINLSEKNEENRWYVNLTVLMMRICIRQLNKNDAIAEATKGIAAAKKIADQKLKQYLERCIAVINEIELDDLSGKKQLQRRQAKILAMMQSDKIRSEFSHLFRTMSALPASRRMNIIPGASIKKDKTDKVLDRNRSNKSFAMEDESFSTQSAPKGANFISLVQYHI
ncbi:uncharacterized protein LOC130891396 [Diorhabda carinulata]|uniref:uncharacterized protein LOC130891396 n=1 Tax=Diorhabda carinulata TaxID=1163345 RepID=UPI0025A2F78F|nr:uncharacterized protein LOC130891396 [Diorhabda carinulata]